MFLTISILLLWLVAPGQTAKVAHVSDGDSFILASGERVRMIGINAPELKDRFGPEAKDHLTRLIGGKTVTLERDPLNDDRDQYGRLLRFVTLDGRDIDRQMIADGYAYAFLRYPFAEEKRKAYREEEAAAEHARIGIWAADQRGDESRPTTVPIDPPPDATVFPTKLKWIAGALVVGILLLAIRFALRR